MRRRAVRHPPPTPLLIALCVLACAAPVIADGGDDGTPRYRSAMQSELEDMGFAPFCEALAPTRARCRIDHTIAERDEPFHIGLVYSDVTDTVYIYVDRFLEARTGGANTADLMRRLMELNWARLGAKFEWNPRTGEVRLSTLMHTDSNFDRRAFRSLVRTLTSEAAKQWPPLSRLVERDKP